MQFDGGTALGLLDEWNPRSWRTFKRCAVVIIGLGLATHQAWATSAVEYGLNWLMHQEQARLQPMVDAILATLNERLGQGPP